MKAQRAKQLRKLAKVLGKPEAEIKRLYNSGELKDVVKSYEDRFKLLDNYEMKIEIVDGRNPDIV